MLFGQGAGFGSKRKYMFRKVTIQLKLVEGDSIETGPFLSTRKFKSFQLKVEFWESIKYGFLLTSLSSVDVPVLCSPVPFQNSALSSLDLDQVYIELKLDCLFCSHVCFVVW
ncbi:hypothetical protein JHK85_006949 [Glycine max]|nr:hypothetical protein JHK85_006949 [Glycine max]